MSKNIFGLFATFNNQEYRKKIEAKVNDIFKEENVILVEKFKNKSIWQNIKNSVDEETLQKIESIFALDNDSSTISKNEMNLLFRLIDCDLENNFDNDYKVIKNNTLKNISEDDMEYYYNLTVQQATNINKPSLQIGAFKKDKDKNSNSLGIIAININDKTIIVNIDKSVVANGNFRTEDKYNTGKTYPDIYYITDFINNIFENLDEQDLSDLANHIERIELKGIDAIYEDIKNEGVQGSALGYYNFENKNTITLSMEKNSVIKDADNSIIRQFKEERSYKEVINTLKHELTHVMDYNSEIDDIEVIPYTSGIEDVFLQIKNKLEVLGINNKQFYVLENQKEYLSEYNSSAYKKGTDNSYNALINVLQQRLRTADDENTKQKISEILESINKLNEYCNAILEAERNKFF